MTSPAGNASMPRPKRLPAAVGGLCVALLLAMTAAPACAEPPKAPATSPTTAPTTGPTEITIRLPEGGGQAGFSSAVKWVALITVLSLAPAVLVMVTSFTRIVVVLGLLRQALATQQLPPNQVLFGLALLMTVVVMAPTYKEVNDEAIAPYMEGKLGQDEALTAAGKRVRGFMTRQIEAAGNADDVYLFLDKQTAAKKDLVWRDVRTEALIPAFVVSELKVAFMMGFKIFLPFLIIDMLVSSVLVSMGMLMVPPVLISLPFKLLLFVLADGWHLVVGTLMGSFR
jgi:flagellar biosynthetic protein FliP